MPAAELLLLGPPRLVADGTDVVLTHAKGLALLGFLAARRDPVSREQVLALLWPESAPEAARKNLRNTLWAIGRALGPIVDTSRDERLSLSESVRVDLSELVATDGADRLGDASAGALAQRAALYRGPFLDGLSVHDAPDFELWLAGERDWLAARYLQMLEALVVVCRAAGDWAGVADAARRALAVDRLHEPMQRQLLEALARTGQRAEALRAYEVWRDALASELGAPPLPETTALVEALRSGTFDATAPIPDPPAPSPRTAEAEPGRGPAASPSPFLGRLAEQAALDALARATAGAEGPAGARVALLVGEPGIGKTRLWQEWSAGAPAGAVLLPTRALESTRTLPFVPVIEILDTAPLRAVVGPASPLSPAWLADLTRLLPDLRRSRPELPPPGTLPPEEERRRLFEALAQALVAVGGRPAVVFLDDAHWADETTLSWLGYLVHRLREEALLLVLAFRQDDAPLSLRALAAGWEREGIARRLALAALDETAASTLLVELGAPPEAVPRLRSQARGNPLFLTELARAGGEDVPPELAELVGARLARLPEPAQAVLQAAAVLEPDATFERLRRVTGLGEDETLAAVDLLVGPRGGVLVEQDGCYRFAHPLVADIVRARMGAARRAVLHRRAAEALEAAHAADLATVAGPLALHLAEAGEPARAASFAALAAERALELAAPAEAADLYARAAALEPTPARQLDLAHARLRLGDRAGARLAFEAARAGFEAAGERRLAAEASLGLAASHVGVGQPEETLRWAEHALALLEGLDDPAATGLAELLLATARPAAGETLADAERHLRRATRLATEHDLVELLGRSRFELGNLLARKGDLAGARAAFRDAIGLAHAGGDAMLEVLGHNNAAYHALLAGDLADARRDLEAGLRLAEAQDLVPLGQWLFSTAGELAMAEGRWDEAETWLRRALAEAERQGNPEQVANVRANLALVARGRGQLREAALLLAAAAHAAAPLQSPYLQTVIDLRQAELALERSTLDEAAAALARAEARLADEAFPALGAQAQALRAELAARDVPAET